MVVSNLITSSVLFCLFFACEDKLHPTVSIESFHSGVCVTTLSQFVATCHNVSQLVATCHNLLQLLTCLDVTCLCLVPLCSISENILPLCQRTNLKFIPLPPHLTISRVATGLLHTLTFFRIKPS